MPSVRRLTAILAADVAGYSRLMGADEEGTHERLKAHLGQLVDPKIKEHRGRTVKNTGDGLLVEFPSVVDAVRCATEIQRGMVDREPEVPEERRIRFRIGVNLGDVIAKEHDIFGDGVNIAAPLGALAWAPLAGVQTYTAYRANGADQDFTAIGTVAGPRFIDAGLSPATSYLYRGDRPAPGDSEGPTSPVGTAKTLPVPPSCPTLPAAAPLLAEGWLSHSLKRLN
jgi:hypothetical protein